jgi:hypothetical protein
MLLLTLYICHSNKAPLFVFAAAACLAAPADPATVCKTTPSRDWLPVGGKWGCSQGASGDNCTASCDAGYAINGTLTVQCSLGECTCQLGSRHAQE